MNQFLYNLDELTQSQNVTGKDERVFRENNWVRGINNGDQKAFEAMYRYYYPRLAQFIMRYVHSKRSAEDVVQNIFYRLWKNRVRLEPKGTLRSYLYTAARNQSLKHLAKQKNENHSALFYYPHLEGNLLPEERIEYKEFVEAFQDAVKQLPERRRHIFLLHREDKLTYREIAEVLEISIKTVETQMSRSIKFLTEKLSHFRD